MGTAGLARDDHSGPSTSEYVRRRRIEAALSVEELAARSGVDASWLEAFEIGHGTEELTYDRLLALVRATEPPRPDWWDEGHEHDLHLGPRATAGSRGRRASDYWARIESVRAARHGRP